MEDIEDQLVMLSICVLAKRNKLEMFSDQAVRNASTILEAIIVSRIMNAAPIDNTNNARKDNSFVSAMLQNLIFRFVGISNEDEDIK